MLHIHMVQHVTVVQVVNLAILHQKLIPQYLTMPHIQMEQHVIVQHHVNQVIHQQAMVLQLLLHQQVYLAINKQLVIAHKITTLLKVHVKPK